MHELPVILGILNTVQRTAEENHLCSVTKICLRIGELSDLVEECMQIYFDSASEGTVCEGAQLVIVRHPAKLRCTVCGVHAKYARQNGSSDLVGLVLEAEVLHSYEMRAAAGLGRKRGHGALRVTQSLLAPFDVRVKFSQRKGLQPAFFVGLTPLKVTFSPQDVFRLFKLFSDAADSLPKQPKESHPNDQKPKKDSDPKMSIIVNETVPFT